MPTYTPIDFFLNRKQPFGASGDEEDPAQTSSTGADLMTLLVSAAAAWLSWQCNTKRGEDTGTKVVYALFAFFFGWFYLIYYFISGKNNCAKAIGAPV